MIAKAAPLLAALLLGLPGCSSGERREVAPRPPVSVAGVELYPVPDAVVEACRSTQRQTSIQILCPTRLPRAVRDVAGSSAVPPPVLTAFQWDGTGLDFSYSGEYGRPRLDHPDRFFHLQVIQQDQPLPPGTRRVKLGGKVGLLAPASSLDYSAESYFGNHWRFFWTERGADYAATLHHFGGRTRRLLDRLVRDLRPAAELRPRGSSPGVSTIEVPVPGPVSVAVRGNDVWVSGQGDRNASGGWLARIDAGANRVSGDRIRIVGGGGPSALLVGSSVWVAHRGAPGAPGLQRLDPDGVELTGTALRAELVALAETAGSLWAVDHRGTVIRTSGAGERVVARIPVGRAPAGIAAGAGDLWVGNNLDGTVARIEPRTNRIVATIRVPAGPVGVTYADGAIWVASHEAGMVSRIDPRANRVVARVRLGRGLRAIAAGEHGVWVANELDDTVVRIDARANRAVETVRVGAGPAAIAMGAGAVWVANNHDGTLSRVEP